MAIYHVTFGQQYPRETHPTFPAADRDGWVDIVAPDFASARSVAFLHLGAKWAGMYPDDERWRAEDRGLYPLGCLATFTVVKP